MDSIIDKLWTVLFVILIGLAIFSPVIYYVLWTGSRTELTITVQEKERVNYGDDSRYLVWSTENRVFQVTDSWFAFKFDASNRYGQLQEGKTYNIVINGWRVHFFSWYPNILEIEEYETE